MEYWVKTITPVLQYSITPGEKDRMAEIIDMDAVELVGLIRAKEVSPLEVMVA
jgi:hypothetical protein